MLPTAVVITTVKMSQKGGTAAHHQVLVHYRDSIWVVVLQMIADEIVCGHCFVLLYVDCAPLASNGVACAYHKGSFHTVEWGEAKNFRGQAGKRENKTHL